MKGQTFIILAVLLVLLFFLIKSLVPAIISEEDKIEVFEFKNLKEEIINTILFSREISNISSNLEDFLKFSKTSFASRGKILRFLVLEIYYPKIIANQKTELNVSVVNFFGYELKILNITFSYDNSSKTFYSVKDGEKIGTSFYFNISSSQKYKIEISYENRSEELEIFLEIGKSKLLIFFEIQLENDFKIKDIFLVSQESS